MKKFLLGLFVSAFVAFAPAASAASNPLAIGTASSGTAEIDIWGNYTGHVSLYCDGELVLGCDEGGVTYSTGGVYVSGGYGYYTVYGLPAGDYTMVFDVMGSNSGYSYGTNDIQWSNNSLFMMATVYVY